MSFRRGLLGRLAGIAHSPGETRRPGNSELAEQDCTAGYSRKAARAQALHQAYVLNSSTARIFV
jgi:hypothetical protein